MPEVTSSVQSVGIRVVLSLCMIVRDEERFLPGCLGSLAGLPDQIIIVDTGSQDRTVEIARYYGAQVYFFPWCDDFAAARNESLRHATGDWILWFDADFILQPGHAARIRQAITSGRAGAYFVNVRSRLPDGEVELWNRLPMLFRNLPTARAGWPGGVCFEGAAHEQLVPSLVACGLPPAHSDIVVEHLGYLDRATVRAKSARILPALQAQVAQAPEDPLHHYHLGQVYLNLGEYNLALAEHRAAAQLEDPLNLRENIWIGLIGSAILADEFSVAAAAAEHACRLFPDRRFVRYMAALAHCACQDFEAAIEDLIRARALPDHLGPEATVRRIAPEAIEALLRDCYRYRQWIQVTSLPSNAKETHSCSPRIDTTDTTVLLTPWLRLKRKS